MSDAELKAVAEGMGLKKIDTSEKENLVYRILDHQAETGAAANADKRRRAKAADANGEEKQKKRTRKKKDAEEPSSQTATDAAETLAAQAVDTANSEKTPDGQEQPAPVKKRRGRHKKVQPVEQENVAPKEAAST